MIYNNILNCLHIDFNYDYEGLWSLTLPQDADKISEIISNEFGKNIVITDNTAGLGGNVISFSKFFNYVIGIESDTIRFNLLRNNIKLYNLNNVHLINNDCIKLLNTINNINININCYFFDPPWGGPKYKYFKKIKLKIGTYTLNKLISIIKIKYKTSPIIFKLPYNYNLDEFSKFNYKIYYIKNYLLLIIY
jgi:16S rRNA G966 N2-methylase RsmD